MKMALIILAWVVLPVCMAAAEDFKCPEPTMQVANNVKGDLNGQAQTLIRLGSADLKGRFETTDDSTCSRNTATPTRWRSRRTCLVRPATS